MRADTLGDLALKHQDHPSNRATHLVEPAQDRACRVERQIADHLDRWPLDHRREFDFKEIRHTTRTAGCPANAFLKALRKSRVKFDQP